MFHLCDRVSVTVGSDNFAAEGKRKPAWKLPGRDLLIASSGYLAYAAGLLTQLSLLHKKSQCSRYGPRSEAVGILSGDIMGLPQPFTGGRSGGKIKGQHTYGRFFLGEVAGFSSGRVEPHINPDNRSGRGTNSGIEVNVTPN